VIEAITMKPKFILCLMLALSGALTFSLVCRGEDTYIVHNDKILKADGVRIIKINGLKDAIYFTEQPTLITVQMVVASYPSDEKQAFPKVDELHRQVWLLRVDGTPIPQSQKPVIIGISNAGSSDCHLIFSFQNKSTNELAGIVMSVDGKLYCQELKKN
jgi:hypothetical protein